MVGMAHSNGHVPALPTEEEFSRDFLDRHASTGSLYRRALWVTGVLFALGVVGFIIPFNGPIMSIGIRLAPALAAGNTVVLKPSEVTPFSSQLVAEIFAQAGLPENVLQVIVGDGETGAALCEAGVDKISFTGSVATGRKVAASSVN